MIGIYGGSFDPPHIGHLGVILHFWNIFPECKKLLLVPNYISPFKKTKGASEQNIIAMLEILIQEKSILNTVVEDVEILKKETSYTIDTIEFIHEKYPNEELYFIIGIDNLKKFPLWKEYKKILESTKLLIFDRDLGNKTELSFELKEFSERIVFVDNPLIEASSSVIRDLPHHKRNAFLTNQILHYIEEEELYGFRKTN
ncbi:MAG: nicotinate (nicotinamide) nucleotide adenylyltransferase [Leptospiraceae bacterium]|nr:nicotinate (nicotinamide) nucleotide adenylyltransferase [Leptospiraceae bacterium]MBK7056984.1 nicotinate (nicotinamide) nucleotide adenylyltransferase [Leptospiraceae bacterium]